MMEYIDIWVEANDAERAQAVFEALKSMPFTTIREEKPGVLRMAFEDFMITAYWHDIDGTFCRDPVECSPNVTVRADYPHADLQEMVKKARKMLEIKAYLEVVFPDRQILDSAQKSPTTTPSRDPESS